jgi:hypothetical protein
MTVQSFPRRKPDGSFCVEVVLRVKATDLRAQERSIEAWARNWLTRNRYWDWKLAGRCLDYFDDFSREPFHVRCTVDTVSFRLEGRPSARWWKDWLAFRIVEDLRAALPEVKDLLTVTNCPDK